MLYHIYAFIAGFLLDLILGDPEKIPHPICGIGWLISKSEQVLYPKKRSEKQEKKAGRYLVIWVLLITGIVAAGILTLAYQVCKELGLAAETVMTWQILATKSLWVESEKVYKKLEEKNLQGARIFVSRIVGRDTDALDEIGVAKATIETIAENTSDGVIAPMLYLAIGGPVLGFIYKAVNTMDSMVGYKSDRYLYFGRTAAKLDDVVNFIPARLSAMFMIAASFLPGKDWNGKEAWRIFKRDRFKHTSPNSAQTEATCAGALGIQLAGNASYFGKPVKKPYLGDPDRQVEAKDIQKAGKLLFRTAWLGEIVCLMVMGGIYIGTRW
ncbi:MAG: adenosylcobinamide-phosphate synthase CbiB [Lachnospiraceae bacterium]|nr:adenosylcobinamide-phosphate synthase CbiB [Lachnospiraceae bacterium]